MYITSLLWLYLIDAKIGYFWHITDLHYDPFHNSPEFHKGGYYTIEQSHSMLRIIVLNSVLWAGGAARTDGPHRRRAQWVWVEHVLSKARQKNKMVYLVAHAGPGVEERHNAGSASASGGGELTSTANARMLHVIRAFSVLSKCVMLTHLDRFTARVLDYAQYYLDISSSRGELHWSIECNLTQFYGLREITANSLDALGERMRNHHDRTLFTKYLTALRVRHNTDATCAHIHYCAITWADYHEFRACVQNPASALASQVPHTSAAVLLYALLIIISS